MFMPWGKYRGCELDEVPSSYLCWILEEAERVSPGLRHAIAMELGERYGDERVVTREVPRLVAPGLRAAAHELVQAGYRALAKRQHPDTGGSHDGMLRLTAVRAALLECIGPVAA